MRVLMIDNYDSFTYNLVQYLGELGAEVEIVRNDRATVAELLAGGYERCVVSPGPCTPNEAGITLEVGAPDARGGGPHARGVPRPSGDGAGVRGARHPAPSGARQGHRRSSTMGARSSPASPARWTWGATTRWSWTRSCPTAWKHRRTARAC